MRGIFHRAAHACSRRVERMTPGEVLLDPKPPGLSAEQALPIARLDAEAAYGDLDAFRITIARQPDGWHIDYELLDAMRDGGEPHYEPLPARPVGEGVQASTGAAVP